MSVRDGLLAVLSLGPAYGLQLHAEFTSRAPHRAALNVGQVYSTLDRAMKTGLVESAGTTADGLPLFRLTTNGELRADTWMSAPADQIPSWDEMLDQIVITATITPRKVLGLAQGYRQAWYASQKPGTGATALSTRLLSSAAIEWLASVDHQLAAQDPIPLSTVRPRRGRRPLTPTQPTE